MKKRTLLMSALALATAAATLSGAAHAQDFPPKKPVTLVVGFAAGGAADAAARLIAKKLGENIGQSVVVASGMSLPVSTCGSAVGGAAKYEVTRSPSRSCSAGAPPL